MSVSLRVALLLGILIYVLIILRYLKQRKISLRRSILWFALALVLLIMDLFPGLVDLMARLMGVALPVNAVYIVLFFFLLTVSFSLSSAVTRQQDRIKALTQRLALLEDTLAEMRSGEMSSDHMRPDLKKESVSSPDNRIDEEAKP